MRGGCPHGADGVAVTLWSHSWSEPRRAPLWPALSAGRLSCPICGESRTAGNGVAGRGGQRCGELCCVSAARYATLAVFDHTHPHAHTETAAETPVFRKNSGVGAHVDLELACWGSGPELCGLGLCLCSMCLCLHLGLIVVIASWGDREGQCVQSLGSGIGVYCRVVLNSSSIPIFQRSACNRKENARRIIGRQVPFTQPSQAQTGSTS